ncbi:MAG: LysM peptidoglycan-binding domain-containing protein [Planctomycetota bacterium]
MAVTVPYKIALGCSSVALLFALSVRLLSGGNTAESIVDVDATHAADSASVAVADAAEVETDSITSGTGVASDGASVQAPSKSPPALPGSTADPLAEANTSDADSGGEGQRVILDPPPTLTVGRLPEDATPLPVAANDSAEVDGNREADPAAGGGATALPTYTVRSGDTFEGIARRELGSASRWVALAKANPTVDPLKLRVGEVLRLPPEVSEVAASLLAIPSGPEEALTNTELPPPPDPVTYVVRGGDSLSTIAARFYADSSRWQAIYNANRDQLKDPHAVRIGMELRIPPAIAAAPGSVGN